MEIKVEGSRRNKKYVESILPSVLAQLKLNNSTKALVVRIANETPSTMVNGIEQKNDGVTFDLTEAFGSFLVVITPKRRLYDIGSTLCHEMVHVKQMAKGTLKSGKNGVHFWAGKKMKKNISYLDQPWEIEAFSRQELLLRRAYAELESKKA
jgi:hypothetical protein